MEENNEIDKKAKPANMLIGLVILGVLAIGGFILLRSNSSGNVINNPNPVNTTTKSSTDDTLAESNSPNETDEDVAGETKTINIEAESYSFNPKEIRLKKGESIQIVMTAKDMMHDFNIDEFDVKLPVTAAGETNSVTFIADTIGEFEYYCSVGQHRQLGQVGTLVVEE